MRITLGAVSHRVPRKIKKAVLVRNRHRTRRERQRERRFVNHWNLVIRECPDNDTYIMPTDG